MFYNVFNINLQNLRNLANNFTFDFSQHAFYVILKNFQRNSAKFYEIIGTKSHAISWNKF
jgi:hypothetical protein